MPYITREDGERFVIPSYRDVLAFRQKSKLKKEILLLSESYGEFIAMQKKSPSQYEVAFSPDTGYLLGESIWHHFKRPWDMIYCEAIPETSEAIFVIVKAGSVYLDGSFPKDSIPEELVIFLTQENSFEIYIYGDVPISETPEEGKFSFEPKSIKSFTVLEQPIFATLPLWPMYQLRPVEQVLRQQGIGVFPVRQLITTLILLGLGWMLYSYLTTPREIVVPILKEEESPYKEFNTSLQTPAPEEEIYKIIDLIKLMLTMPGWSARSIDYSKGNFTISVQSRGSKVENLFAWADNNGMSVAVRQDGIFLSKSETFPNRPVPKQIFPIKEVIAVLTDRLANVYPGNNITLGQFINKGVFTSVPITINMSQISMTVLALIAEQFKDLPLVLQNVKSTIDESNNQSGTIVMDALGGSS